MTQSYSSALRESGNGSPMRASVIAVLVNLVFNYLLIFGKLGLPALGVKGAAIATVLSRVVELLVVVVTAHKHQDRFPFLKGLYRSAHRERLGSEHHHQGMPLFKTSFSGQRAPSQLHRSFPQED